MLPELPIDPPIETAGKSTRYRLVVRDGTYTAFINGRQVLEQEIPSRDRDPWLAIQADAGSIGRVADLKLVGTPSVPTSLSLSDRSELAGWLASYYDEPAQGTPALWEKRGDEIVGRNIRTTGGSDTGNGTFRYQGGNLTAVLIGSSAADGGGALNQKVESVLQYHRPMLEDGEIAYEFFYEPGKAVTHPALDRLTFLLEPEGIAIHWMTDAQHDRTGVSPGNRSVEPDRKRGPGSLPLKPGTWNQMRLKLAGDVVSLFLNDTLVYERPLEPTNQRNFGFFHYADESEARARSVTYRGNWPRAVPADLFARAARP
jgi:hypothetical protein